MTDTKDQDVTQLQRRARRRLVGAIALVVLAVIVLPIVFDKEPRPISQDLVIQIPSQDAPRFDPGLSLPPPAPPAADAKAAPAEFKAALAGKGAEPTKAAAPPPKAAPSPARAPEAKPAGPAGKDETKDAAKAPAKAPAKEAAPAKDAAKAKETDAGSKTASDAKRVQALLEGSGTWIVPMGSYTSAERIKNLQAKAKAAGYSSYTEQIKGPKGEYLIRLRAGPFAAREDADRAHDVLKSAGLVAGTVAQRK